MCSRFENKESGITIFEKLRKDIQGNFIFENASEELKKVNIAPINKILTVSKEKDDFKLKIFKWGIRFDKENKSPLIFNSRIETIKEKKYWTQLFYNKRCLIPATAFYEWKEIDKVKVPQRISIPGEEFFFMPSIYVSIEDTLCASLITTVPNKFMKSVHNRMPVIFGINQGIEFLKSEPDKALEFCIPLDNKIKMEIEIAKDLLKKKE
jgi:putative SOS response-associated peptidase YedK